MNRLMRSIALLVVGIFVFPLFHCCSESVQAKTPATMNDLYPDIVSGLLTHAGLTDLPKGLILRSDKVEITAKELGDSVAKAPKELQDQLDRNRLFLLEQMATEKILLKLAKDKTPKDKSMPKDADIVRQYLQSIVQKVKVSDEEVRDFYKNNQDVCGGASFKDTKDSLKGFVLQQKQQDTLTEVIKNLGKTVPVLMDASWVKDQVIPAQDNPVDKARLSRKPSMVDFGANGCRPCDMMVPVLDNLKSKYEGKVNVLFVHVQKEQILAARYGIQSIPVQVFFDKDGKEVFRHTGFFPQKEIEKKLSEMGAK